MFVSPSNPTGAVYPRDEVEAIGRWAVEHGIWVITDEIYEHLTYDDHEFHSMPALVPELADHCVVLNGVAKTYAMTGWRVGLDDRPDRRRQGRRQPPVAPDLERGQRLPAGRPRRGRAAASTTSSRMREAFDRRGKPMHRLLNAIDGVELPAPAGRLLRLPVVRGVLGGHGGRPRRSRSTLELAEVILEEAKVAIVPGEAFGAPGYARLSFALGDDDLGEGIGRIADLLARR